MRDTETSFKHKIAGSLIWKFLERGSVQIVQFVVSIVIARLVTPEAYGSIALLTVFTTLATVFVQSGLSTALIQKKDVSEEDFSSVFFFSLVMAAVVYCILFFSAPIIASFYEQTGLVKLLRIMSLTLFPGALNSLQIAALVKSLQFRKQFYSSLLAALFSGAIGIAMALYGLGAWALVFQQLSYQVVVCIVLWITVQWRPKLKFSFVRTKVLLSYGVKLLLARLVDTIYHNLENLIIGKKYSTDTLAYFSKGKQFPLILVDNIDTSMQSVMLSAFSQKQEQLSAVKGMLRRTMALSTYLIFPMMVGLACVGEPLIYLALGENWKGAIPFLQIYCFISMLFPLQTVSLQAINAIGHSDVYLKLMMAKRIFGVAVLALATIVFDEVLFIAWACLITEVFSVFLNFIPNRKYLSYEIREQLQDILSNLILSIVMGVMVNLLGMMQYRAIFKLLLQCTVGVLAYFVLSVITKNKSLKYILQSIGQMKCKF